MKSNINEKELKKLLNDTEARIIVSDNGVLVEGKEIHAMALFSLLVSQLSKAVPKDLLEFAFKNGLSKGENKEDKPKSEQLKDILNHISDTVEKIITKIDEDHKNE